MLICRCRMKHSEVSFGSTQRAPGKLLTGTALFWIGLAGLRNSDRYAYLYQCCTTGSVPALQ